jgi:hypothetical protein
MKSLVIALAIILLFPLAVDAGKGRNRVYVNDYTNSPVVAETVDDFNAIMPKRGPHLIYRAMPYASCEALTVCVDQNLIEFAGHASWWRGNGRIVLNKDYVEENTVCHEFMHVLTRVGDAYDTNPDSCVYGQLNDPGGADIALLREQYQRKKR